MSAQNTPSECAADAKEHRTLAERATFAASIRSTGGECQCDEYGLFRLALTDGRVFRRIGMHGWGGLFRRPRPQDEPLVTARESEVLQRHLVSALRRAAQARDEGRKVIFYLAVFYCGSETLDVEPADIASLTLEAP